MKKYLGKKEVSLRQMAFECPQTKLQPPYFLPFTLYRPILYFPLITTLPISFPEGEKKMKIKEFVTRFYLGLIK